MRKQGINWQVYYDQNNIIIERYERCFLFELELLFLLLRGRFGRVAGSSFGVRETAGCGTTYQEADETYTYILEVPYNSNASSIMHTYSNHSDCQLIITNIIPDQRWRGVFG
jgi:hypothetical protein